MLKWFRNNLVLITIVVFGFWLRTFRLDTVPTAMNHDELDYLLNGFSFVRTGHDLYGQGFGLTLGGTGYSSFPGYIAGFFLNFFGLNQTNARMVPVIFGVISIWSVYKITESLFKNKNLALLSGLFMSLSLWAISISRMVYDPPTACFFFLLALAFCLSAHHLPKFLLGLFLLTIGALSYYGAQPLYLPVVVALILYRKDLFRNRFHVFAIVGLSLLTIFVMWSALNGINKNTLTFSRTHSLSFTNTPKIEALVVAERADHPSIINQLFINKVTVSFRNFASDYLSAFNPEMIFVTGDPNRQLSLWTRGELIYLDLLFILFGLYYAVRSFPRQTILIFILLAISPLSVGLSGRVYTTRSFLQWPLLLILSSMGLYFIYSTLKHKFLIVPLILIYLFMITNSLQQYFFRYPIYANEIWFGSERQLANYLGKHQKTKYTIYAPEARQMFMEYIFYNSFDPEEVQKRLNKNNLLADINYQNITFINGCPDRLLPPKTNLITHSDCYPQDKYFSPLIITQDKSNRTIWLVAKNEK